MRLFTEQENEFLDRIVKYKADGDIAELAVDRLLKNRLICFALKWQITPKTSVEIYSNHSDSKADEQTYFEIADFIYFIQELEQIGFVKFQKINDADNNPEHGLLYNREDYNYISGNDEFLSLKDSGQKLVINDKVWITKGSITPRPKQKYHLDFALDLERCASSIIYPLPVAEDYVANNFKTLDKRQYDKQIEIAYASLDEAKNSTLEARKSSKYAMFAAIISVFSMIISIILSQCNSHIDDKQIQDIIKAIENPVMTIESSQTIIGNTIVVHKADTNIKKMACQIQKQK